jgi:hypothetical protein
MHYQTPKAKKDLAPVTKFLKEMGIGNVEAEPSLNITRTGIPSETRVVVLAHER